MSKKKSKLQLSQGKAQFAINKTNEIIEKLGNHTNSLYSGLNEIQELFDTIKADGYNKVLAVTISSGLSGTYNAIKIIGEQKSCKKQTQK